MPACDSKDLREVLYVVFDTISTYGLESTWKGHCILNHEEGWAPIFMRELDV